MFQIKYLKPSKIALLSMILVTAFFLVTLLVDVANGPSLAFNAYQLFLYVFLILLFLVSIALFLKPAFFLQNIIFVSIEYLIIFFVFLTSVVIIVDIFVRIYGESTGLSRIDFLSIFMIGSLLTCLLTVLGHAKFVGFSSKKFKKLDTQMTEKIFDVLAITVTIILLMNSTYSSISSYSNAAEVPKALDEISEYTLFIYTIPIYIITIVYKILDICALHKNHKEDR